MQLRSPDLGWTEREQPWLSSRCPICAMSPGGHRSTDGLSARTKWGDSLCHLYSCTRSAPRLGSRCHLVLFIYVFWGFPGGSKVKAFACNVGDLGLIPGSGRSPGEGNGNPLQYSCLENPMVGGAWWATVHGFQRVRHDWATSLTHSFMYLPLAVLRPHPCTGFSLVAVSGGCSLAVTCRLLTTVAFLVVEHLL